MNIRELSSQFNILIFTSNVDLGTLLKVQLSRNSYQVFYIEDEKSLVSRVTELVPHIIILDLSSLSSLLSEIVEKLNHINPEIKIIFLTKDNEFQVLSEYSAYNVFDIIFENAPCVEGRTLWAVDRCCETIYLTYKNEQLYEQLNKTKLDNSEITQELELKTLTLEKIEQKSPFEILNDFKFAESKEEIIQILFKYFQNFSVIYFKYLTSLNSFMLAHVSPPNKVATEGVGCILSNQEAKELNKQIVLNIIPASLSSIINKIFNFRQPVIIPLFDKDTLDGVFIFDSTVDTKVIEEVKGLIHLTILYFSYFSIEKRLEALEVIDPVTEVFNKMFYDKKLSEEFERAKRFKHPLSIIKLSIDDLYDLEKSLGSSSKDQILRQIGEIVKNSSRVHDFTCRTAANEFSIILPQCPKKGAVLRAERLRRMIESHTLLESGLRITSSLGVSEYPSLSYDIQSLNETSAMALRFIVNKGGNSLCLYKQDSNFVPEFSVDENQGQ